MTEVRLGIIMNGVTGRMGTNQHLIRSVLAIQVQGGIGCCQTNANWSQYRPGDTRFMPKVDAIRPTRRCDFL